jgi:hypothetical protein
MTQGVRASSVLRGISEIRRFFHSDTSPYRFISATNFNLLGIDQWVRNFRSINYIDCFDSRHPNIFVPAEAQHDTFTCLEDVVNHLLEHKEVIDHLKADRSPEGGRATAVFLMFDAKTEELCRELGLKVCFPRAELRSAVDSKISATRIADRAGVKSVPNVLAKVDSYAALRKVAHALGPDLVVQTAFGDSGHTTFFISSEADWEKHAKEIVRENEVKVMRRIRCRGAAIEACVTRHGTLVAPLMTELVGFKELTPYRGGWCGNEICADAFSPKVQTRAREATFAFGEEIRKMGYLGYFELDFLIDLDHDKVYLGEVNPRITGASSLTNLSAFAYADAPLFLFHLLEWSGKDYELNVGELNARWAEHASQEPWGQLIIKHTDDTIDLVTRAPPSGLWRMGEEGKIRFVRPETHVRGVDSESEAFFLRISKEGDYRYEGADLGILIMRGRMMTEDFELTTRAKAWIRGIRREFEGRPLASPEVAEPPPPAKFGRFKIL